MSLIFDDRNVAKILDDAIVANPQVTQKEVAEHAGFEKPNVIYMFKTNKTKVPLDKAGKVAEKLGLDPREFWFKCLHEYQPQVYAELERVNKQPTLSSVEIKFIKAARKAKLNLMDLLKDANQEDE